MLSDSSKTLIALHFDLLRVKRISFQSIRSTERLGLRQVELIVRGLIMRRVISIDPQSLVK